MPAQKTERVASICRALPLMERSQCVGHIHDTLDRQLKASFGQQVMAGIGEELVTLDLPKFFKQIPVKSHEIPRRRRRASVKKRWL